MTPEDAKALRAPFPPEAVGKLPRVTCGACRDRKGACDQHSMKRCAECKNYITSAHTHLDYVGHAAATDRLIAVDPDWSWEPFALDPNGLPAMHNGTLWIRLTVCGKTLPGFGDGSSVKECIGDAIRNSAMRFGVALDLWAKEDLGHKEPEPDQAPNPEPPSESDPIVLANLRDALTGALGLDALAEAGRAVTASVKAGHISDPDADALRELYRTAAGNLQEQVPA